MISGMPMNNRNPRPRGLPTLLSMLVLAAAATASAAPQAADPGAPIDSDWVLKIIARPGSGRAPCRERVGQYVSISVVAVHFTKKIRRMNLTAGRSDAP